MQFLVVLTFVAVAAASHHHGYHDDGLVPYVVNPGGIGGIYKGPDSATIIKGPDGGLITSKQIGGAVAIDDAPHAVIPLGKPVVLSHGPVVSSLGLNGVSTGAIHAGPVSTGAIHAGPVSTGAIHAAPVSAGSIHEAGASSGSIHAGGISAGAIHAGPSSSGVIQVDGVGLGQYSDAFSAGPLYYGSIHTGLLDLSYTGLSSIGHVNVDAIGLDAPIHTGSISSGAIHAGPVSTGSIHSSGVSAGSIHAASASAGLISTGSSSAGSIHVDGVVPIHTHSAPAPIPSLIHSPTVVLAQDPIIVSDIIPTHDPKIVEERVIIGHKVISVPKQVEENTDLVGPSGTISTRGGDAVISGPSSITIKGDGVVTDVKKQDDVQLKTVEIKPVVAPIVTNVATPIVAPIVTPLAPLVPAVHPVVEGAGTIITHNPIVPIHTSHLGPVVTSVEHHGNLALNDHLAFGNLRPLEPYPGANLRLAGHLNHPHIY